MVFREIDPKFLKVWLFIKSSKECKQKISRQHFFWRFLQDIWLHTQRKHYLVFLENTPTQAKSLLYSLEQVAKGIGLYVKSDKKEIMCFNQNGFISPLNGKSVKLVEQFTYLRSDISSTESNVSICIGNAWTNFQAVAVSVLLYGCTTWTITKHLKKKLGGNYGRMLQAVLYKSWKHPPTKKNIICMATYFPFHWPSKLDDKDMLALLEK